MPVLIAAATFASTGLGGLFALRHKDRLHLILGLSAGVLLGVIAFDLFPEIFELASKTGRSTNVAMIALVVSFLAFHAAEKTVLIHAAHEDEYGGSEAHQHTLTGTHGGHHHGIAASSRDGNPKLGLVSAVALSLHSLVDGIAIGLAFQAGTQVGVAVALAVIAHDFADGLNTVSLMLSHGNSRRLTLTLLGVDALAPVVGAALTLLVTVPDNWLLVALGSFTGVLLYICTADILPEAHANHPSRATLACTIAGTALMYVVMTFAL